MMLNPYDQGQLLLTFAEERRRQMSAVVSSNGRRSRRAQRLLAFSGAWLIRLGMALRERGQLDIPGQAVTPYLEMK